MIARLWLGLLYILRISAGTEHQLVESTCKVEHRNEPNCGSEHWRVTGFQRSIVSVGRLTVPLTGFFDPAGPV